MPRNKIDKYNFTITGNGKGKKKNLNQPYFFICGEIPFENLQSVSSNSDTKEPKNFNRRSSRNVAKRSIIA